MQSIANTAAINTEEKIIRNRIIIFKGIQKKCIILL